MFNLIVRVINMIKADKVDQAILVFHAGFHSLGFCIGFRFLSESLGTSMFGASAQRCITSNGKDFADGRIGPFRKEIQKRGLNTTGVVLNSRWPRTRRIYGYTWEQWMSWNSLWLPTSLFERLKL